MGIELSILHIPRLNLSDIVSNIALEQLQVHVGGVILEALSFVAKVDGALKTTGAAGESVRSSEGEGFLDVVLLFVEEILVTEACDSPIEVVRVRQF